jgi:hypothetical protein
MPDPREANPENSPPSSQPDSPTAAEMRAMWNLHRLQAPTFDDLTAGLCLGLVWCMALWAPMLISALL